MGYGNSYGKGNDHSYGGKGKDYSYGGKDGGKSKDSSYGGKGWSGGYDGGGGGGGYDGGKGSSGGSWKGKPLAALPTDPNEQFEMMQWMQGTLDQMKVAKGIGKVAPSGKGDSYGKGGSGGKDGKSKDGKSKGGKDSKGGGGFKKTKLCTLHEAGYCGRHHCTFAHGEEQMGQLQPAEGFNAAHASGTLPSGHAVQVWSAKGGGKDHAAKSMGSFVGSTFGKGKRKGGDGPKPHKFMPWKLRLSNAYQGRHRKCPAKDTIQYETVQDGESYTCTVRCEDFTLSHDAGPGFASKKEAEEAAAKAAVEHEFPEWLEKMAAEASGKPAPDKLKKKQSWKTRLHQAFTKEHNESPQQSIEYTVEEREGGFIASVTCDRFVNSYVIDEIQSSRTLAQELAAKMALEGEFPSFALADALENDAEEAQTGGLSIPPPQKKAKYEKAEAGQASVRHPNFPLDTKCQLNEGVMIILGRSVLKGDVEYNTTEQGGMTIASVTLSCLDPMQTFSGEGVSSFDPNSKRLAHKNAAEAALATLQEMIDAKRPEHEAMKQAKRAAQSNKQGQKRAADGEQLG